MIVLKGVQSSSKQRDKEKFWAKLRAIRGLRNDHWCLRGIVIMLSSFGKEEIAQECL